MKPSNAERVFIEYFISFYGPVGLYPFPFRLTKRDIKLGIKLRGSNFEGDSIDREAIRDIILTAHNHLGGAFAPLNLKEVSYE